MTLTFDFNRASFRTSNPLFPERRFFGRNYAKIGRTTLP